MTEQEARKIAEKELKRTIGKLELENNDVFRFELEVYKNNEVYMTFVDVFIEEKFVIVLPA